MPRPADDRGESPKAPSDAEQVTTPLSAFDTPPSAAKPNLTDPALRALQQRYDILAELGGGGMGIVYKARDHETGAVVALKVLQPEIAADAAVIARFKSELLLARKITHKNVCRIYELLRFGNTVAIAMEFVEGESLRAFLNRLGGVWLRRGLEWAKEICGALAEAHAQGVIHRDLKPENIFIDVHGHAKVMDFGIARSVETAATQTGGTFGTPAYMSPEQAEGKPADARSDIYALGLVFYEMFVGRAAFQADTPVSFALEQIHETPPPPRSVEPSIPASLDRVIQKCLEKDPSKRFQSAEQLEAALTGEPEEKPAAPEGEEVTMPPRLAFWQRSDWYLLGSAALGLILFFPLFYRFHPASALEITVNAERARQIAAEALKKLGWEAEAEKPELEFGTEDYYTVESMLGSAGFIQAAHNSWAGTSAWGGDLKFGPGIHAAGHYGINSNGELSNVYRFFSDISPYKRTPSPPDAAATAQMKELARNAYRKFYGQDAAGGDPIPQQVNFYNFTWRNTLGSGNFRQVFWSALSGGELTNVGRWVEPLPVREYDPTAFEFPWRSVPFALLLFLLAILLFITRKLHRETRPIANLLLAALLALAVTPGLSGFWGPYTGPGAMAVSVLVPLAIFSISLVLAYAVLNAVLYYLRGRYPAQASSYLLLFREHIFARGAGLALLRGTFAGLTFSGGWMAVLSLAGRWGKAVPAATWLPSFNIRVGSYYLAEILSRNLRWSQYNSRVYVDFGPLIARNFPMVVIVESLILGWLLVAFPLSLLGKVSRQWRVLLPALAALWMASGFSLLGAMVFPWLPYYIFVVLQAVFFGALFLRYDVLTTLSAAFTIEVFLLAFPSWAVLQQIDPVPYLIPIGLWVMLFLAAAGLYFRPQLVASYRRVVAVFE